MIKNRTESLYLKRIGGRLKARRSGKGRPGHDGTTRDTVQTATEFI